MDGKTKKEKLPKEIVNVIRTTQRNNIELTNIADNKANMLLSLNGIMISIAVPLILSNVSLIEEVSNIIPLVILTITCFTTMYISAMVLRPSNFEHFRDTLSEGKRTSPFFFGNYFKMSPDEFFKDIEEKLKEKEDLREYLIQDLFFVGKRLGYKMQMIRSAFTIFIGGIFLTLATTGIFILWKYIS